MAWCNGLMLVRLNLSNGLWVYEVPCYSTLSMRLPGVGVGVPRTEETWQCACVGARQLCVACRVCGKEGAPA